MTKKPYYVGVDVGTQSVRAALVKYDGKIVKTASSSITTWNPKHDFYEQSSENIWNLCTKVIQAVTKDVDKYDIGGIGFDATCSLVALDADFKPVSLNQTGALNHDIILWMDHRAIKEADFITNLSHSSLKNIGGKMSPEMQPPKLMWIKKNLPKQWEKIQHFFDLPDFLTWKATTSLQRSLCSLVCKFLYQPQMKSGWDVTFWKELDLEDVISNNAKIGRHASSPGVPCGKGLSEEMAAEFNMLPHTPVSTSVIDAYAGALGVLACNAFSDNELEHRMAMICGTSTCHVKIHKDPIMTTGVWGPYFSAMIPNVYCVEAGQSAAGSLLDFIIDSHPAAKELKEHCGTEKHIMELLNDKAKQLASKMNLKSLSHLTYNLHIYPDFHGNRSPLADAELTGMMSGLTLTSDITDLIKKYIATLQALAYETRHIIKSLQTAGHIIEVLILCGGLSKNSLYVKLHADIIGIPIIVPDETEPVLLGAAILGATAAGEYPDLESAMNAMSGAGKLIQPDSQDKSYHEKKYEVYCNLLKCQQDIRATMYA